jgi:hypothetical protein
VVPEEERLVDKAVGTHEEHKRKEMMDGLPAMAMAAGA